jgi:hypothetical protein
MFTGVHSSRFPSRWSWKHKRQVKNDGLKRCGVDTRDEWAEGRRRVCIWSDEANKRGPILRLDEDDDISWTEWDGDDATVIQEAPVGYSFDYLSQIARFLAMRSIRGKSTFFFCGDWEEEGGYIVYLSPEGLKKSTFPLSLEFDYNRYNRYKSALEAHDSHCLDSKYNNQHVPRSNCTSQHWGIRRQRCQSLKWWLVARQYQHQLFFILAMSYLTHLGKDLTTNDCNHSNSKLNNSNVFVPIFCLANCAVAFKEV